MRKPYWEIVTTVFRWEDREAIQGIADQLALGISNILTSVDLPILITVLSLGLPLEEYRLKTSIPFVDVLMGYVVYSCFSSSL